MNHSRIKDHLVVTVFDHFCDISSLVSFKMFTAFNFIIVLNVWAIISYHEFIKIFKMCRNLFKTLKNIKLTCILTWCTKACACIYTLCIMSLELRTKI